MDSEYEKLSAEVREMMRACTEIAVKHPAIIRYILKIEDKLRGANLQVGEATLRERERCAVIVENWHYKKGGYCELAHILRSAETPKSDAQAKLDHERGVCDTMNCERCSDYLKGDTEKRVQEPQKCCDEACCGGMGVCGCFCHEGLSL